MSKSSELDKKVKIYIIDSIDNSGYSDRPLNTVEEKLNFLRECFEGEAGWNIQRRGRQAAMREWLTGLPSAVSLPVYNYDIIQWAIGLGLLPEEHTEKQADKILDNHWSFCSAKILQLFDGYKVPKGDK